MINPIPVILTSMLILAGCAQSPIGEMKFPAGTVQHAVHAGKIQWKPCPPGLPSGCEIAVLEGNPKSPDLFTVRFRMSSDFFMPAHTHPKDERVTVLQGKVAVAFGKNATRASAKQFGPGDYYVNSRGAIHTVWANAHSIIQITGIGPWEVHFVEKTGK